MPTLTVGNAQVEYRAEGSGQALVLVHGVGPGSVIWDDTVPAFRDRNTVILPDLSGSARVKDDGADLTTGMLAEQLAAIIEDSGAAPVDLLGFSLGAPVAATVAATRPDLVRRLILVAGFSHPDDEYIHTTMTLWQQLRDNPAAFGRLGTLTAFSPAHLNRIGREAVEQATGFMRPTPEILRQIDLCLRLDVRDLLPHIQAETLVIGCTRDGLIPVRNSRQIHAAIPASSYAEVESGHVVRTEQPTEFLKLVGDFIHAAERAPLGG